MLLEQRKIEQDIQQNRSAVGSNGDGIPLFQDARTEKEINHGNCSVCLEQLESGITSVTVCGHMFCKMCIKLSVETRKECPTCRRALTKEKIFPVYF